jgi:hypothetical protein
LWDNKGEAFNWLDAAPFKLEIWGLFRDSRARLATNLNDLENLSDHIHYYSTSQDSLAPKQKEEETKAKALLKNSQWDNIFYDLDK